MRLFKVRPHSLRPIAAPHIVTVSALARKAIRVCQIIRGWEIVSFLDPRKQGQTREGEFVITLNSNLLLITFYFALFEENPLSCIFRIPVYVDSLEILKQIFVHNVNPYNRRTFSEVSNFLPCCHCNALYLKFLAMHAPQRSRA